MPFHEANQHDGLSAAWDDDDVLHLATTIPVKPSDRCIICGASIDEDAILCPGCTAELERSSRTVPYPLPRHKRPEGG